MAERLLPRLPKRLVARMPTEYLANEAEYWQRREELLADYSGRWIAFDQGQVVASGSNFTEVLDQAGRRGHPFAYIDCVGAEGETYFRSRRVEFSYDFDYVPTALPQATVVFSNFAQTRSEAFTDVIPDTGSDLSALTEDDADRLNLLSGPLFPASVVGVGSQTSVCLVCRGHAHINKRHYSALIQVIPDQIERFLGREVMNRIIVTFDGPAGKVIFEDYEELPENETSTR